MSFLFKKKKQERKERKSELYRKVTKCIDLDNSNIYIHVTSYSKCIIKVTWWKYIKVLIITSNLIRFYYHFNNDYN